MFGYGTYDLAINTLEKALSGKKYIAGDHFTAADLIVGANVNFMLALQPARPTPGVHRLCRAHDRTATPIAGAQEIDGKLIAEAQAAQPN